MVTDLNGHARRHTALRQELLTAIERVMDSKDSQTRREAAALEAAVASMLGTDYVIGVSNGRGALELALRAVDVRERIVLTTSFAAANTGWAILAAGGRPAFVDIDPQTLHMDVTQAIFKAERLRPKVIVAVHLFGRVHEIATLCEWAKANQVVVIEDASQAFGAVRGDIYAGTFGSIGCFGFGFSHDLGGWGGGLLATNHPQYAAKLRGWQRPSRRDRISPEANDDGLQEITAAAILAKLKHFDRWKQIRLQMNERYRSSLAKVAGLTDPPLNPGDIPFGYPLRVSHREELLQVLVERGIDYQIPFERTLPELLGSPDCDQSNPEARLAAQDLLSLPLHPYLSPDEQQLVLDTVADFYSPSISEIAMAWQDCSWAGDVFNGNTARKCDNPLIHSGGNLATPEVCEDCRHRTNSSVVIPLDRSITAIAQTIPAKAPQVLRWAVGVTTALRSPPTLKQTLDSLQKAGWSTVRIFSEPGVALADCLGDYTISRRDQTLGPFPNWWLGLAELVLREPRAEAYFICQDDVLFSESLRSYLEQTLWPATEVGVVSVYCPSHVGKGLAEGFHVADYGWETWGALAYVFPNPSARALLADPEVLGHRHRGPASGLRNIDSVVGHWCRRTERPYFVHTPSLAQHIGDVSTIWSRASNTGKRRAATFISTIQDLEQPISSPK